MEGLKKNTILLIMSFNFIKPNLGQVNSDQMESLSICGYYWHGNRIVVHVHYPIFFMSEHI